MKRTCLPMHRREFLGLVSGAAVTWPGLTRAQDAKTIPRLCFITYDRGTVQSTRYTPFFEALRQLGYVDGKTISIAYLSADGRADGYPALTTECLRLNPDIIAVSTTPAAQAAKDATRAIPIVMISLGDPVGTGLVKSLARPEGNVTGVTFMAPVLAAKRLELLKELAPQVSRVFVLTHLADPIAAPQLKALEEAAKLLGTKLQIYDIGAAADLPAAFEAAVNGKAEALITTGESIFAANRDRITKLAAAHRLPAIYSQRIIAEAGGLITYNADASELYGGAATYVDKILKGAKPADLPVQQPVRFELVVNLKTAKALGLTIPQSILLRADLIE